MQSKKFRHGAVMVVAGLLMCGAGSSALAGGLLAIDFEPSNFTSPTVLSNAYWPLLPGSETTTFIYIGETEDGCAFNKITAVPGDWKMLAGADNPLYAGFMAQVVLDREWELEDVECDTVMEYLDADQDWQPAEADLGELTYDWYAQDDDENIWYMGEASRDFGDVEIGEVEVSCPSLITVPEGGVWPYEELFLACTEGSWEAGQLGQEEGEIVGEAGIVVPSDMPAVGEPLTPGTYWMQEVAENAEDMAKVLQLNAKVSIEDGQFEGDYEGCRKVKEWTALEPGESVEHKYYCAGEGLLLIQGIGGGPTESEVLISATP